LKRNLILRQLLDGKQEIGCWLDEQGNEESMHSDREQAKETIRKLRALGQMDGVHIAMAHVDLNELGNDKLSAMLI
jgi:hypothetical protein